MSQRRTLTGALEMTAETLDLIKGSQAPMTPSRTPPTESQKSSDEAVGAVEKEPISSKVPEPRGTRRTPAKSRRIITDRPAAHFQHFRIPPTTRLTPETVAMLRRTCLERRLAGTAPATLQDIMEEAVQLWISHNDGSPIY